MEHHREIIKHYSNGELSVVWKPSLCIHAGICFAGLPKVFNPSRRPWIDPMGASSEAIRTQVAACPSGALSIGPPRSTTDQKGLI
jgi:uncharacterized Fe-S cluster protein YjdI